MEKYLSRIQIFIWLKNDELQLATFNLFRRSMISFLCPT